MDRRTRTQCLFQYKFRHFCRVSCSSSLFLGKKNYCNQSHSGAFEIALNANSFCCFLMQIVFVASKLMNRRNLSLEISHALNFLCSLWGEILIKIAPATLPWEKAALLVDNSVFFCFFRMPCLRLAGCDFYTAKSSASSRFEIFNLWHANINAHIFYTVFYPFLLERARKICLII